MRTEKHLGLPLSDMDFVFPIEKSPISAANRRQAAQEKIDLTNEPSDAEQKATKEFLAGKTKEKPEDTGAVDRFKQDAQEKVEKKEVAQEDLKKTDTDDIKVGNVVRNKEDRTQTGEGITYPVMGIVTKVDEETFTYKDREGNEQVAYKSAGMLFTEEGKAEDALESSKSLRETEVELDEQPGTKITMGDLGAYNALQDIYDSDLTTDRLIDGPISDGLKKKISTEAYNQWRANYYDTSETPPSKEAFIEAFRRAHKLIHPEGRSTKGDKAAEETAKAAEKAKRDAKAKDEILAKQRKELEQRNLRKIDLANKKYNQGEQKSVVKLNKRTQAQAFNELAMDMDVATGEWTVESIDEETGEVELSSSVKGYRLLAVDPRRLTVAKKIKKEEDKEDTKETPPSPPLEEKRWKRDKVEQQGSEMEELPALKSGTYLIQFGNQKSRVEITDDSWGFPKGGGTTGPTADFTRPETFGELILKMGKNMSDLSSIRYEDEYIFDASFDGVAFQYFLKDTIVEPIPLQQDNLVWKYGKNSETALDEEQDHVQIRSITKLSDGMSEKEVRSNIAEGMSKKGLKARSLPPAETKSTRAKSNAIIAIRHDATGQVFLRSAGFSGSVKKGTQGVDIFNFKKSGSDFVSALPSAVNMKYSKLPEGFTPIEVIVVSAQPGRVSAKFDTLAQYEEWTLTLPEVEQLKLDQLPHVDDLIKRFNSTDKFSNTLETESDLNFAKKIDEQGKIVYVLDENRNPVIHESVGAYIGTRGKRPAWHYIKIDEIEKQIGFGDNAPLVPVYNKILNILTSKSRSEEELTDEGMAPFVAGLRIGDGDTNELGQSQIDTRIIPLEEDALEASSKALAKALVSAIYKRSKRRYELDNSQGRESLFKVTEDGNRMIEQQSDESSAPDLDGDYDWDARNPMAAAKAVFFEQFTADQLKIVHQEAINAGVFEMSSQEIRDKFSLDRLGDAPIVQVDKRANLISVYEMAANSDNQGSEADQMINMTAETSDSAIQRSTASSVDVRPIAAFIRWVANEVEPIAIDEIVRVSSASVSQDADALFDQESKFYASKGRVVRNNFDSKALIKEIELSEAQRENLSVAYSSILNSIRSPENTVGKLQDAFEAIADSFGDDGTRGWMALEDSQITNQRSLRQELDDAGISESTQQIFKAYVQDALKQALPGHKVTVINLMSEHLGNNVPKALTTMRTEVERVLVETEAINSISAAPGQKPDASMMLDQLPDTTSEVTESTVELDSNVAQGLPYALSQSYKISPEQAQRNFATIQRFFPDDLPGSSMSGIALERIGKIIGESEAPGAEFGKKLHEHLTEMLVARDAMGLPPIAFGISDIASPAGTITRGQFIPSEGDVNPLVQINPNFYLGEDDIFGKPFPFTGNVESDVLATVSMHELWHGTMEEPLHVYEQAKARGEDSPIQETIDLIDEVIRAVANASQGTQFSSLFTGDFNMQRREILNRVWNRRDFAKHLSTIKVDPALRRKIDQNGEGFINNLLDALYAAYLKLLDYLGIDTEGTALKSLLDLSKQLDTIHRELQQADSNYGVDISEAQLEAVAAMAEQPAIALYSKLVQVLSGTKTTAPLAIENFQSAHRLPTEQVVLLRQGGLEVVDAKLIKSGNQNYEFYLVEGTSAAGGRGFYQAAIQQQGTFAGDESAQLGQTRSGQQGLQGLTAVREMGRHMQDWTSRYGDVYMGSYNSDKSDSYARILARLGFIVDEDPDNNWGRPTEEGKFIRIRQSEEMKAIKPPKPRVTEVQVADSSVDQVAISQRINQLTKGNPKKKIPGLIRQAMQEGNKEQAEAYKQELAELKKKQSKKSGFELPSQAEAGKWPELLMKAGVSRAELDATIGPLLEGKQIVTKTELAEVASIADQSKMIAEAVEITDRWGSYSDNKKRNLFRGENPEYIEILTFAPQFSPLSRGYLGIVDEELGDETPVGIQDYLSPKLEDLRNLNLLSSYDLMQSAGMEQGIFSDPRIVQQIMIKTQYVPKVIRTSADSILGSADPALTEVANGYIKVSLWEDASSLTDGTKKMFITISNSQIEEIAQKAKVGGVGERFGDEYPEGSYYMNTGKAMSMWVNEMGFIEGSLEKFFNFLDKHSPTGPPTTGPLFTTNKLMFEAVKGGDHASTIIDTLNKYKDEHDLWTSEFRESIIDSAVNFKKEGGVTPQIEFKPQPVIVRSLRVLSHTVRSDASKEFNKALNDFAYRVIERHKRESGRMIDGDASREELNTHLQEFKNKLYGEEVPSTRFNNFLDQGISETEVNEMYGLVKDFKIFYDEFFRLFEWRLNTTFKIMGGQTFDDNLYYAPEEEAGHTLDTVFDFQNYLVNGDQEKGTLRELITYMLDGDAIMREAISHLIDDKQISSGSPLVFARKFWKGKRLNYGHAVDDLRKVMRPIFGMESMNNFKMGDNIFPQVAFGEELASTINDIYADKTELMPVEHGAITKDQATRVVNKISQWAQRYKDNALFVSVPGDKSIADRFARILRLKNLRTPNSPDPFNVSEYLPKYTSEGSTLYSSTIPVSAPTDTQLWETRIQLPTRENESEIQARGLGEMGGSTHHDSFKKYLHSSSDTEQQLNRHHLRVTFVDADGVRAAFIDESQSDIDQLAQQDIIEKLDDMYSGSQTSDLYEQRGYGNNYSYDLTREDSPFYTLHLYDPYERYKKGDVVVEGKGIFVAQTDIEAGVSPRDTIESGKIDPFKKWRMLGKRKSGLERGYSNDNRPPLDAMLKSMRDFYLVKDLDLDDLYHLVHIQPELIAYHNANQPSEDFEQNAGLEVYDIPDSPFKGVRVLQGRNEEGKMMEFYGEEARQYTNWNPAELNEGEVREEYLKKIEAYGGFFGAIPDSGPMSISGFKAQLKNEVQKPVRGGESIFRKNVELAAIKHLTREMAKRNVRRIVFTRGDVIYPIVSGAPSDIGDAAEEGGLKSQGIQQAYIQTAQRTAKYFGVPLQQIDRPDIKEVGAYEVRQEVIGKLNELVVEDVLSRGVYETDAFDWGQDNPQGVRTGNNNPATVDILNGNDPATEALFRDGIVEFTQEVTRSGHAGPNLVFALDPNNPIAVQKLAGDDEVFQFGYLKEGASPSERAYELWKSTIGETALKEGASPNLDKLKTKGRSLINSITRVNIPSGKKERLLEVARQAVFQSRRQAKLLNWLIGASELDNLEYVKNTPLLSVFDDMQEAYTQIEKKLNLTRVRFEPSGRYTYLPPGSTDYEEGATYGNSPKAQTIQITGRGNESTGAMPDEYGMFQPREEYSYFFEPEPHRLAEKKLELVNTPSGITGIVLPPETTPNAESEWNTYGSGGLRSQTDQSILRHAFELEPMQTGALFTFVGSYKSQSEALADFDKKYSAFNKAEVYAKGSLISEEEMDTLYSDYFKERTGRRPNDSQRAEWASSTLEAKRNKWSQMGFSEYTADPVTVDEANFIPVLLEYHGSYIAYALDLEARQMMEDISAYFNEAKTNGMSVMDMGEIKMLNQGFDLPRPIELLFYRQISPDFEMITPATTLETAAQFGRTEASDAFREEISEGDEELSAKLKYLDYSRWHWRL